VAKRYPETRPPKTREDDEMEDEMLAALDAKHAEINRLQKTIAIDVPAAVEAEIVAWLRREASADLNGMGWMLRDKANEIEAGEHRSALDRHT
jgi:hypothetical protein